MLTLYGNLESGNVYKVRLLLEQRGIRHQRIDVSQTRGEPRSDAFREINPMGKIPAIRFEDGRILSESGAILYYFGHRTPFLPDEPFEAACVLRWMFFEQYSHEPFIAVNRYILRFATGTERERLIDRIPDNLEKGDQALAAMELHLRQYDWLAASRYTIADIALYAYTHNADEAGFDLGRFPSVVSWLARVRSQPNHISQMEETSTSVPKMFSNDQNLQN